VSNVITVAIAVTTATTAAAAAVKVWDIERGYCTHNFTGHTGIVSTVLFHPEPQRLLLATSSDDCSVR
jgi:U3 small nucleolar RNA-associated protein 13